MKNNELAVIKGSIVSLNIESIKDFTDNDIVRVVRHAINHYNYSKKIADRKKDWATAFGSPHKEDNPVYDDKVSSEEIYNQLDSE